MARPRLPVATSSMVSWIRVAAMVVFRTLTHIDRDWMDAWMTYLGRLDFEVQGMFANGVRAENYSRKALVMTNKKFTEWARANNFLFSADKK